MLYPAFVSSFLLLCIGRKTLLWTFSFVLSFLAFGISFTYPYIDCSLSTLILFIVFVLVFIVVYEFSLGSVCWVYTVEVMPPKGFAFAVCVKWTTQFIMEAIVTMVIIDFTQWTHTIFLVFGFVCAAISLFCKRCLRESKGLNEKEVTCLYSRESK